MELVIVTSSVPENDVRRIITSSSLVEVCGVFRAIGIGDWTLYAKGRVAIEAESTTGAYIAIGPKHHIDTEDFLRAAETLIRQ